MKAIKALKGVKVTKRGKILGTRKRNILIIKIKQLNKMILK